MGWSYSLDLRKRVVGAFEAGDKTDEEVAELFQVGEATVHRWKRLERRPGRWSRSHARGEACRPGWRPTSTTWCGRS